MKGLTTIIENLNKKKADLYNQINNFEQQFRDGSIYLSAADVITTATALFFGDIDQATQISQGCGGGGNPGLGWERDDDDKWMKKCFKGACCMMKKPPVQRVWRRWR